MQVVPPLAKHFLYLYIQLSWVSMKVVSLHKQPRKVPTQGPLACDI